ncbi:hypothetical protein D7Y13_22160 [Corallococcus praedator]|uniref:DUF5666 domain-containing protein n=1 Tax=Corallococcus praedator TaxID=2316724 RepID=A0ABX9QG61_9BACT|nr:MULTISPECIES: hypothetical protein [Corallococcus]RKH15693.1 hypothetical protein D7X74_17810 [Corallococcus sp. CA047B]RKH29142.1 hypothetical protein D7X75_23465 [Corallococcus sp. CA031C]RKI03415.1 hypothetical protein D7Y13_22160 [Corallococcus praedator]
MAALTMGSMSATTLAQPAPQATSTKTKDGQVKSITPTSVQLAGATASAPPLTYVIENPKQELKATLDAIKPGDTVRVTYAPNAVGAKVITQVEKLPSATP